MAWRYCPKCDSAMELPTFREVIAGEQHCGCCGWIHEVEQHERECVAENLMERIDRIEAILATLTKGKD